jgi:hypothetical protein
VNTLTKVMPEAVFWTVWTSCVSVFRVATTFEAQVLSWRFAGAAETTERRIARVASLKCILGSMKGTRDWSERGCGVRKVCD